MVIRKILLFLAIVLPVCSMAKTIQKGEYYFNTDPGIGKGIPLAISDPGSTVMLDLTIDIPENLVDGFNTVYFRFQDSDGHWSHTYKRIFIKYTIAEESPDIDYVEYFIDDDPGYGKGISIALEESSKKIAIDQTLDVSHLDNGFHALYVRPRSHLGQWGILSKRVFYLRDIHASNIIYNNRIEYFFVNGGFVSDTFRVEVDPPAVTFDMKFIADISALEPDREYEMNVVVGNESEVYGKIEKRMIKACSPNEPVADFEFSISGYSVDFANNSEFATNYFWDFGDGNTDTIENPTHNYSESGEYLVQLAVKSFCKNAVITKKLKVEQESQVTSIPDNVIDKDGISVYPNPSENYVTISFTNQKTSNYKLFLYASSGKLIRQIDAGDVEHKINLSDIPRGVYHLVIYGDALIVNKKIILI